MKVELIPVIEINFPDHDKIKFPDDGPHWEYAQQWNDYNQHCFDHAGFKEKFIPYYIGSSFYRLNQIPKSNLERVVKKHFYEIFEDEELDLKENLSLDGGYVLKINTTSELFPQCCGRLSDISFWESISKGVDTYFWIGHPHPAIHFEEDKIIFDCKDTFAPPAKKQIIVLKDDLRNAVVSLHKELMDFANCINSLRSDWGSINIGNRLVFEPS